MCSARTRPTGVAVNPVTGEVYVTNFDSNTVSVIS
ncbi:PE-PGRS family protein [Mycobacterium tuberculosis]|nr:PE-PGRS family protein [Mycobacterium tuberculosis]